MSALGEALGNSVAPHVFTDRATGKRYALRLIDQGVKAALEKALFERSREILRAVKDDLSPEEYQVQLRRLIADYQAGEFSPFTSERGMKYLKTHDGVVRLCALLFGCDEVEMMRVMAVADNQAEITALLEMLFAESLDPGSLAKAKAKQEPPPPEPVRFQTNSSVAMANGGPEGNAPAGKEPLRLY